MEKLYKNNLFRRIINSCFVFIPLFINLIAVLSIKIDGISLFHLVDEDLFIAIYVISIFGWLLFNGLFYGLSFKKNKINKAVYIVNVAISIIYIVILTVDFLFAWDETASSLIGGTVAAGISLLFGIASIVYYVLSKKYYEEPKDIKEIVEDEEKIAEQKKARKNTFIIETVGMCLFASILFVPFIVCFEGSGNVYFTFFSLFSGESIPHFCYGLVVFLLFISAAFVYVKSVTSYLSNENSFAKYSRISMLTNYIMTIVLFVAGMVAVFIIPKFFGYPYRLKSYSFVPFILLSAVSVVHAIFNSKIIVKGEAPKVKCNTKSRWLILVFVILFVGAFAGQLFLTLIKIDATTYKNFSITCIDLLKKYKTLETGFSVVAFIVYSLILIQIVLVVFTVSAVFSNARELKRCGLATIIISIASVMLIGLFGKYYEICQAINMEQIQSIINTFFPSYGVIISSDNYSVSSSAWIVIAVDVILGIALFGFKPFTKNDLEIENAKMSLTSDSALSVKLDKKSSGGFGGGIGGGSGQGSGDLNIDNCPAFTELDEMEKEFNEANDIRRKKLFANPTLPDLTSFIVDYARESRLHLSYTHENIAQFIAGLGATKLSILQGMSGTGKTSLPKIFLEAVMGNCEIVEVESSWKDKNELLGYYNEFSKSFTPKKFTRALYKAAMNPDVITFVVLDEMNLSRIEYYFSDFLSLMENEPENREIQLVNVRLQNRLGEEPISYKCLKRDHTLHIPENIWFIGTANRDESTFEISDKVYDRAHTMNFNKRAPKVRNYTRELEKRYLPYKEFQTLLDNAIKNSTFELDTVPYLKDVEEILRPFNISFGNRIMNQIEAYVRIYSSCFVNQEGVIDEAVEDILLSKVVAKLEFKAVEDKADLVRKFEKLNLLKCAEFVKGLNEDL